MNVVMIKDEYTDLVPGYPYNVKKIFRHGSNYHVMVEGSPRRYLVSGFEFWNNGKKLPAKEAFRLQQIEVVKRKLGMK